jgi:hypothetical protein
MFNQINLKSITRLGSDSSGRVPAYQVHGPVLQKKPQYSKKKKKKRKERKNEWKKENEKLKNKQKKSYGSFFGLRL